MSFWVSLIRMIKVKIKNFVLLLSLFLSACSAHIAQLPKIKGSKLENSSLLLATLQTKNQEILNLKFLAHSKLQDQLFRQIFVIEKPDKFRLETLPLSQSYALDLLVIAQDRLLYINQIEKKFLERESNSASLGKLLHINISVEDLLSLVSARLPKTCLENVEVYQDQNYFQIFSSNFQYYCQVDLLSKELLMYQVRDIFSSNLRYEFVFDNYQKWGDFSYPQIINLNSYQDEFKLEIRPNAPQFNTEIKNQLFEVAVPAGFQSLD